jgi:hypothetical protein
MAMALMGRTAREVRSECCPDLLFYISAATTTRGSHL